MVQTMPNGCSACTYIVDRDNDAWQRCFPDAASIQADRKQGGKIDQRNPPQDCAPLQARLGFPIPNKDPDPGTATASIASLS